jgi:hypothetical protein
MASLRRKYQDHRIESPDKDAPVSTPPAAELPEQSADAGTPPPEIETQSPADKAAKDAIALQLRLREMENADRLAQQRAQPQQHAEPPQRAELPQEPTLEQQIAHLPPRVQGWYRNHPELAMDPERAAQVQYCHHVARRETGEEMTPAYCDRMEQMLGFAPRTNGQTQHRPAAPPPRSEAPARQQQRGIPMSAPPTREAPSMSTGRPVGRRVPLTEAQREAARFSGVSEQEYASKLELMERLRAAGQLDDRR